MQSNASEHGIVLLMTIIPGAFAILAVLVVRLYPLNQQQLKEIHADLFESKKISKHDSEVKPVKKSLNEPFANG